MIYLDSSVALAHLLSEDRRPEDALWTNPVISSRLLEYEVRTRLNNLNAARAVHEAASMLIGRVALLELIPEVVARAQEKLPVQVRTLDVLHLASALFLLGEGVPIRMATYDERMRIAAKKLKIPLYAPLEIRGP